MLLHYLRSGERAYLDSAIGYGDHTVDIDLAEFAWALIPPLALLVLWEVGKVVLRWRIREAEGAATTRA